MTEFFIDVNVSVLSRTSGGSFKRACYTDIMTQMAFPRFVLKFGSLWFYSFFLPEGQEWLGREAITLHLYS